MELVTGNIERYSRPKKNISYSLSSIESTFSHLNICVFSLIADQCTCNLN